MSAGQVSRHKGIDTLIEAAARLRDRGRDNFLLDIYGAIYSPEFAELIRAHDLGERVRLMGGRSHAEILGLYGGYDVFAFPTHTREPFGMVPLEVAVRGCVPVITRRCGVAEWLVHGVHCLKAARTAEAFADVFAAILDGTIELAPIARRGAAAVWRDFHIDAVVPRIEAKLAAAARQSRAGAGTAAEAYRLARLAEQLTRGLIQQARSA
jgi:glycosyltransferase involved in cell wall biosynthesis